MAHDAKIARLPGYKMTRIFRVVGPVDAWDFRQPGQVTFSLAPG